MEHFVKMPAVWLSLASGLIVFASVLSDAYLDRPRRPSAVPPLFDYRYGWSFFAAGAAFVMAEVAAVVSVTAYLRRFPSVEVMVRAVVPGADRRLRERHAASTASRRLYDGKRDLPAQQIQELDGGVQTCKTPPDICTTNPPGPEPLHQRPLMAGTTVPITLMHPHRPTPPPPLHNTPLQFSGQNFQRYATIGGCTLLHQGVLGVSEGVAGNSSSSSSSAGSSIMAADRVGSLTGNRTLKVLARPSRPLAPQECTASRLCNTLPHNKHSAADGGGAL